MKTNTSSSKTMNCDTSSCACDGDGGDRMARRSFLRLGGLLAGSLALGRSRVMAGPFTGADFENLVPADKKLSADWVESLFRRGAPEVWSGGELNYIGMPVGGIGCGQLYLAGDGRLWLWDIFKSNYSREDPSSLKLSLMTMNGHYTGPVDSKTGNYSDRNGAEVDQGFAIRVRKGSGDEIRRLDGSGFPGVTFRGEYPIGRVSYADTRCAVAVDLEAFSPFLPLSAEDSAHPATVMAFTVTNRSDEAAEVDLMGWLQNATCPYDDAADLGHRRNTLIHQKGLATLYQTVEPVEGKGLEKHHGYGSMALSVIDPEDKLLKGGVEVVSPLGDTAFDGEFREGATISKALDKPLVGAIGQALDLAPGESKRLQFLLTWYFPEHQRKGEEEGPMNEIAGFSKLRRHYARWYSNAAEAAQTIAGDFERLAGGTRLWNRTWYDSTLPHWLLDRSFIPLDCLATQTFHWFDNGRPWGWEGVDCCEGTCTHVWSYAQSIGRIFPEIERAFREQVDYGVAFESSGIINYRGEVAGGVAVDGQAGTIIRTLREHQMAADGEFLGRVWPRTKKAIDFLLEMDPSRSGLLEGGQPHTLDAEWFGPMGWISSTYCAALRAGARMATEMGDHDFAKICKEVADRGTKSMVERVYNGEYFIHLPPDHNHINTNSGSHIDQVLGQSWAWQVGLPRVLPEKQTVSALNALWKYNFTPDAGGYARKHTAIKGTRVYADVGEAGMLMTTWPQGGSELAVPGMEKRKEDFETWLGPGGYFDECMTGFEYQVASHMIYEGDPGSELVKQGLAVARAVHDRYGAAKRNPYNEIECGDHYSRAMAVYGVYLAVCGFDYHGPKGKIAFAPRVSPENFHAAFTAAEGWGSYSQTIDGERMEARLRLEWGSLAIQEIRLDPRGLGGGKVTVTSNGKTVKAAVTMNRSRAVIRFDKRLRIVSGEDLKVVLS